MAEPPKGRRASTDDPDYNWLYGSRHSGAGSSSESTGGPGPTAGAGHDPDPTRMLPTMERPSPRRGGQPYEDPTRPQERAGRPTRRPAAAPPPPRQKKPRRRFRAGWVRTLVLVWLVFLVAVPLWAWSQVDKVRTDPGGDRPAEQSGTTYLLVGSDSREGLTREEQLEFGTGRGEGRRTDTIMLLHTGAGPNLLMSIPRDSILEIPGYGSNKVNAAFALGGPRLLVETLELATGIRIDDYVEIGFGGFVNVIDAVGGIEICPKTAMKDPQANLDIEKGCQEADGTTALGYARSRKTSALGDIDRARHQREVVSAVGSEAVSPWSVINPVRYFRLADSGSDSLRVGKDTSLLSTMRFAWAMTRVDGDSGLTCGVPIADLAVNWDQERADRLFELIREDRTEDVPKSLCKPSGLAN
ncbi:MAG TPA: LCP family protein [Nocardioides sp.]|uniref:LCP family protein n=1 Tax=Nocardioides sp. TaxID=35761 RepID=UPI002D7E5EBE|nr:LCP family protein [Nocardioides sp.]HET6651245.1 LCP family protein [Nocardioides sp.]